MIIYKKMLFLITGNRLVSTIDILFIGRKKFETMTLCGLSEITDFSVDKLTEKIKEAMKRQPNLNSKLIYFLGNYYWKKMPLTEERIGMTINVVRNIKSYEEAVEFCKKETDIPIDLNEQCFKCYITILRTF